MKIKRLPVVTFYISIIVTLHWLFMCISCI
uniref:Uncharacterized protein n=1 Tax=Rhizophora mucronata TaxID=61149 RepID=A0A2P2QY82_RHIMU